MTNHGEEWTRQEILFAILTAVLVIIDVFGNTLVVLVIVKDRIMRTPINYLLLNLAIADMMVGIFFLPRTFRKVFIHPSGMAGDLLCKVLTGYCLAWIAEVVSALSLVFIAVERYYAVMHPLNFQRKLTITKIKIFVSVSWIVSTLIIIPEFIGVSYNDDTSACDNESWSSWHIKPYALVWFIVVGLVPVVVMVVLYSKVIQSLWFQRKEPAPNFTRQAVLKSRKKISRMMLTVSVIYAFTCLPSHVLYVGEIFTTWERHRVAQEICISLVMINSSVNPFVYSLQSEQFNKSVKKLFGWCNGSRRTGLNTRGRENEIPRSEAGRCNNLQLVNFRTRSLK